LYQHAQQKQACRNFDRSGKITAEAMDEVKMVVEGVTTTKAAYELARKMDVAMPITFEAYEVLFNGKNPRQQCMIL